MSSDNSTALFNALLIHSGREVSLEALSTASGYAESSIRTYVSKNMLLPWLGKGSSAGMLRVGDMTNAAPGDIKRGVQQRRNRYAYEHLGFSELVSSLLSRSRTNAGLALELINRPELANRLDAFVLLFMTAWEQLLKARLEHQEEGSIFTGGTSPTGRPITIGVKTAIERLMPERKDAVRRNIEVIKDLRDGAAHLLVPEVTGILTRYFQASILNYIDCFQEFSDEPPFRFEGTGLLTLGVPYRKPSIDALSVCHGRHQAQQILALIDSLEVDVDKTDDPKFAVSLRHQLVLQKGPTAGAINLSKSPNGKTLVPVEVPRDPKAKWRYNATECAQVLSQKTSAKWNASAVAAVASMLGVKSENNQYHYCWKSGKTESHSYSDQFIERVVERYRQDPELIKKAYEARRRSKNT